MSKIYQDVNDVAQRIHDLDDRLYDVIVLMSGFQDYDDIEALKGDIRSAMSDLQEIRKELY